MALLLATALLLVPCARGATFDPELSWRTLRTEHFDIHFHQGEEQLADELSLAIEDVYDTMEAELRWRPGPRVQVTLIDRTDQANGYASSAPYPNVVVYVTAPQAGSTLDLYEDWLTTIMVHEYTHVLHLDTHHGVVEAARWLVGRIASTNALSPGWIVEGQATDQETRHTAGGRGRAAMARMILRTSAVEGEFPSLGSLVGYQPDPPGGNLRYLFGQDLVRFVAETRGRSAWTRWNHLYGSSVPYVLPGRLVFGEGIPRLYQEWRTHSIEEHGAVASAIREAGLMEGRVVSDGVASCSAPAFSPDGRKLVWSCHDRATGPAIWLADGDGSDPEVLLEDHGASSFTWRVDSEAFVYAGTHVVNRFNNWSDVFLFTLEDEELTLLTAGARARDPDFSPDGSRLLVVTNKVQDNQLEVVTVDQRREALTHNTDHTQYSTPRYSPDGRAVAVSVWSDGRRDLWLYSPEGEPLRRLTADAASDWEPAWSADGRWLLFTSTRDGIPDIYAIEIATERLYRVTRVVTGATSPSVHPDGHLLAYQQYSPDGWDVRVMPLEPARFEDLGLLPRTPWHHVPLSSLVGSAPPEPDPLAAAWRGQEPGGAVPGVPTDPFDLGAQSPTEQVDTFAQIQAEDVFGEERDYPFHLEPRRYNPLPTLLPRYYLPWIQLSPYEPREPWDVLPAAFRVGVSTGAVDALRRYGWSAGATYRTDASALGGSAALTINRWLPVYSAGASTGAVPLSRLYLRPRGGRLLLRTDDRYWERRTSGWVSVSYPYTYRTTVFGSWSLTHRQERFELPRTVAWDLLPARGTIGTLQGGWRYAWSEPTPYAISREDGRIFSLVGGLVHPWLGTRLLQPDGSHEPFTQVRVTSELREYVVNPWVPNHVLAMRAAGGATFGDTTLFGSYQLGGSIGESPFYATPSEFRMLRGYPLGADIGEMYWLTGIEYRLPLWRIEEGLGALPLYLRYLSGHVFVDAGNAFTTVGRAGDLVDGSLVGAGAELRLAGVYGWGVGVTGRLGYAVGLTRGGYRLGDPQGLYFQVGGSY